jgi:uncharacterized membrane protein
MGHFERIAPWRFLVFFALLVVGWTVAAQTLRRPEAILAGFDLAAATFLVSCIPMFRHAPPHMRTLAERYDANRVVLLVINVVLAVVVFAAIIGELGLGGTRSLGDKLLVFGSLVLAWTFGNAVYALHYAHLFYGRDPSGEDRGGLEFPGTPEPLLSDFAYFAFTLGVAVQTSDVQVTKRHVRNVVTIHSVIGFFFNLGALALAINVLGAP